MLREHVVAGLGSVDTVVVPDDNGKPYLCWVSGSAYVAPLNEDMVSFAGAPQRITGHSSTV